jgi:hypothetical protein
VPSGTVGHNRLRHSDCELYHPTAADIATVSSARAVFINDLNEEFEPWLEPLLKQATFKGAKLVDADVDRGGGASGFWQAAARGAIGAAERDRRSAAATSSSLWPERL